VKKQQINVKTTEIMTDEANTIEIINDNDNEGLGNCLGDFNSSVQKQKPPDGACISVDLVNSNCGENERNTDNPNSGETSFVRVQKQRIRRIYLGGVSDGVQ
jgi:hypothetical protein